MACLSQPASTQPGYPAVRWLPLAAACCSGCVLLAAAPVGAQPVETGPRTAVVTRTLASISLDGSLDEAAWTSAPTIGDLVQRQPDPGAAPTERTEVTLLYDDTTFYIGVMAHDSEPDRILASQMARDGSLNADDRVEIILVTFRDQRSAFYFATNPVGALVDGLTFGSGQLNTDWDAIWDVRTQRTAQGWSAEFAIPFKSLNFPSGGSVWGFNVQRAVFRKLEDIRWSGARLETQFLQVSEAGAITGLQAISQGIGLDVRPFLAGTALHTAGDGDTKLKARPGLDVFYNLTPSLKLTATLNTDFGDTEVDARQINLERFSLFFPEKRAFFLEDAGVFTFASTGPTPAAGIPATGADVYPFFSRRIGLLGGEEVPLDAGVKLTGRVGRTDVGLLDARTGPLGDVADGRNFFVARIKRNIFEQSYIGAIVTHGHPSRGREGQTYGADIRLTTSRLLGRSRNLDVTAYVVRSANAGVSGNDASWGISAHYPNDRISAQVAVREMQENFQPALGFVQRENVRMVRAAVSFNPRPRDFLDIQQMFHDVYFTQFTRLDNGELESRDLYVTLLDWHLRSGDNWHGMLDVNPTFERLFEAFEISPGVVLQPGDYRFTRFKTNLFATAARRPLSANVTIYYGNYWSGRAEQVTTALTYRLPPWFQIGFNTNQTWARLPEGRFTARVFTSNISYSASPRLSFFNLFQFDNRSRNLGWQSRVRWTLQPGNDLFVSFQQGWIHALQEDGTSRRFRTDDNKLSAKLQYSVRF
jgi:hypothetical protein